LKYCNILKIWKCRGLSLKTQDNVTQVHECNSECSLNPFKKSTFIESETHTRSHTPHAADEGASGAHAHPHGGLLPLLLHCPCLQVQNPSCEHRQQNTSQQGTETLPCRQGKKHLHITLQTVKKETCRNTNSVCDHSSDQLCVVSEQHLYKHI